MNLGLQKIDLLDRNLFRDHFRNLFLSERDRLFRKEDFLRKVVDGKDSVRLKDPGFPNLLLGNSACGQIRCTSIFEFNAGIGNVRVGVRIGMPTA